MKDYEEKVLNIMDSTKVNIIAQLNKAYKSGYEDAKSTLVQKAYKDGYADAKSELGKKAIDLAHEESDRAYQQGLDDAWEATRKIIYDDGLPGRVLAQIFGTSSFSRILKENAASEAISKIKKYEGQQKHDTEIKAGDEVTTRFGSKGIVITDVPSEKGDISVWFRTCTHVQLYPVKDLSKTGRHFDQIPNVLAEVRGENK